MKLEKVDRRDLFPFPCPGEDSTKTDRRAKSARARKRRRNRQHRLLLFEGIRKGLNHLANGKLNSLSEENVGEFQDAFTRRMNAAQDSVIGYLQIVADSAIRRGMQPELDAGVRAGDFDYTDAADSHRVWLDPNLISLPGEGAAGTTGFVDLLEADLRAYYEEEDNLRLVEKVDSIPAYFLGVNKARYVRLIEKLE